MTIFEIRKSTPNDVAELTSAVAESREHVGKWMGWLTSEYGEREALQWIEHTMKARKEGTAHEFLIVESTTGEIAGACGLNWVNKMDAMPSCEIGEYFQVKSLNIF